MQKGGATVLWGMQNSKKDWA